jgi:hypothetical protein
MGQTTRTRARKKNTPKGNKVKTQSAIAKDFAAEFEYLASDNEGILGLDPVKSLAGTEGEGVFGLDISGELPQPASGQESAGGGES